MNPGDVAKSIKKIYANAAQQIRDIHKKRLGILRELLEQRAREKAKKSGRAGSGSAGKTEGGYQFSEKEIKEKAQNIMTAYKQGMDNIADLRREGLKVIEKAEHEKSTKKAEQIRQSILA